MCEWRPACHLSFQRIPEVADELPECVRPLGKRYDDVDEHASGRHSLALHLQHGAERPEERELREVLRAVAFEQQLVRGPSVPLRTGQPCDRRTAFQFISHVFISYIFSRISCKTGKTSNKLMPIITLNLNVATSKLDVQQSEFCL